MDEIKLTADANQFFYQDSSILLGTSEAGDHFGRLLAAGDFDGDSYDNLAVGVPYEDIETTGDAGLVRTLSMDHKMISQARATRSSTRATMAFLETLKNGTGLVGP